MYTGASIAVATFNAVWFVNLGLMSISHMFTTLEGGNIYIASNVFFGLPFAQFIGLVFFKMLVIIKRSERVMACLRRGEPVIVSLLNKILVLYSCNHAALYILIYYFNLRLF